MVARKTLKFERNPLLAGPSLDNRARSGTPYREVAIAEIDVDPDQPRRVFESETLNELAASIRQYGVLCPVLLKVQNAGTYRLIAGERRLRAAKLAGLSSIPAVVDQSTGADDNILTKQLVENLQREELTSMERALAFGQLKERFHWSVRDIASHLGVSKSVVQRTLEILQLPDDLQAALIAGASESKILLLAQVENRGTRKQLLGKVEKLTREELEREIDRALGRKRTKVSHGGTGARKLRLSTEDQRIVEEVQRTLGTKVELARQNRDQTKGRLSIDFYSASDLYEIYRRLTA